MVVQRFATGVREAIGGRAVVSEDASGNTTHSVKFSPESVLHMRVDSDAQAGDFIPV